MPGDAVVHVDHGIGKFNGLKNVTVLENDHDCIEITYFNNDKLYVPVENIELLSKYGGNSEFAQIDKLGSSNWQFRKASAKNKINEIKKSLESRGVSVKFDNRKTHKPGWKFAEYELKGVPVRLAMGMRDIENKTIEVARRDTLTKETVSIETVSYTHLTLPTKA